MLKINERIFEVTYADGGKETAKLIEYVYNDGSKDYEVDLGSPIWNRSYQVKKAALNYLKKNNYKEVK